MKGGFLVADKIVFKTLGLFTALCVIFLGLDFCPSHSHAARAGAKKPQAGGKRVQPGKSETPAVEADPVDELIKAIRKGAVRAVAQLADRGAPVNTQARLGGTPLSIASYYGKDEVIKVLLDKGANVDFTDSEFGRTPLMVAAIKGNEGVTKLLLEHGADVYKKDNNGKSAVDYAIQYGNSDVQRILAGHVRGKVRTKSVAAKRAEPAPAPSASQPPTEPAAPRHAAVQPAPPRSAALPPGHGPGPGAPPVSTGPAMPQYPTAVVPGRSTGSPPGAPPLTTAPAPSPAPVRPPSNPALDRALIAAAKGDRADDLNKAISRGANVNAVDEHGHSALFYACAWGLTDTARALLAAGADPNATGPDGRSCFMMASNRGHDEVRQLLMRSGAQGAGSPRVAAVPPLGARPTGPMMLQGMQPGPGSPAVPQPPRVSSNPKLDNELISAAKEGRLKAILELIRNGAGVNAVDEHGYSALFYASAWGLPQAAQVLLDNGADPNFTDRKNRSCAWIASQRGHEQVITLLAQRGAKVPTRIAAPAPKRPTPPGVAARPQTGRPAVVTAPVSGATQPTRRSGPPSQPAERLISAAKEGRIPDVLALIRQGADVNTADEHGYSALFYACAWGLPDVAQVLLDNGANPNFQDRKNRSCAWMAAQRGHEQVVSLLAQRGAKVPTRVAAPAPTRPAPAHAARRPMRAVTAPVPGMPASKQPRAGGGSELNERLIAAAKEDRIDDVLTLIRQGANVNAVDQHGYSALFYASAWGWPQIAQVLLDNGADPNFKDSKNRSCAWIASQRGHEQVIALLAQRGARIPTRVAAPAPRRPAPAPTARQPVPAHHPRAVTAPVPGMPVPQPRAAANSELNERLISAAKEDRIDDVLTLIRQGANVNAVDQHGYSALFYASAWGMPDVAQVLLANGADPNFKDTKDRSCAVIAAQRGHEQVIALLAQRGAHIPTRVAAPAPRRPAPAPAPTARQPMQQMPLRAVTAPVPGMPAPQPRASAASELDQRLISAAKEDRVEDLLKLIRQGANVNAVDQHGYSALFYASAWGMPDVAQVLLANGSDPNFADSENRTCGWIASQRGHGEVVALLAHRGATGLSAGRPSAPAYPPGRPGAVNVGTPAPAQPRYAPQPIPGYQSRQPTAPGVHQQQGYVSQYRR